MAPAPWLRHVSARDRRQGTRRGLERHEVRPRFPFGVRQLEKIIARTSPQVQVRTSSATVRLGNGDGNGTAAMRERPSDFEAAKERWNAARQRRREIGDRLEGATAALALALNPPGKNEPFSPSLQEKARSYLDGRPASPDRLRREIGELQDQLADLQRGIQPSLAGLFNRVSKRGARPSRSKPPAWPRSCVPATAGPLPRSRG